MTLLIIIGFDLNNDFFLFSFTAVTRCYTRIFFFCQQLLETVLPLCNDVRSQSERSGMWWCGKAASLLSRYPVLLCMADTSVTGGEGAVDISDIWMC